MTPLLRAVLLALLVVTTAVSPLLAVTAEYGSGNVQLCRSGLLADDSKFILQSEPTLEQLQFPGVPRDKVANFYWINASSVYCIESIRAQRWNILIELPQLLVLSVLTFGIRNRRVRFALVAVALLLLLANLYRAFVGPVIPLLIFATVSFVLLLLNLRAPNGRNAGWLRRKPA